MADDSYSRGYRSGGRDGAGAGGPSVDPLTELARLIGQSDPFATDGQGRPHAQDSGQHARPADWPDDPHDQVAAPDQTYGTDAHDYSAEEGYGAQTGAQHEQFYDDRYDPRYQDQAYGAERGSDTQGYGPEDDDGRGHPDDMAGYYDEEEASAPRRRGWLVTAAVFVGLALVGAAVAVAYHKVFVPGAPSIIARDPGPTKIIPANHADSRANKRLDRIASGGQNERIVSNEEQPITLPDTARSVPPPGQNSGFTIPATPGGMPSQSGPAADTATAPRQGGVAPRKIHTVPIKIDGSPADTPAQAAPPPVAAPTVAAPRPAASAPPARAQSAPRAAAPAAAASNGPLSLTPPEAGHETGPPPVRTSAVAPQAPAPKAESAGAASGYYVQVTAQKSEADAESSFRGIQSKYANLLGGHEPVIRRKDLGSRGIFYGAQVGPLSHEAAVQLCENLKSAGGPCMIQRN